MELKVMPGVEVREDGEASGLSWAQARGEEGRRVLAGWDLKTIIQPTISRSSIITMHWKFFLPVIKCFWQGQTTPITPAPSPLSWYTVGLEPSKKELKSFYSQHY